MPYTQALVNTSLVYLVLSAMFCMSELGVILSVVSTPLGHFWCFVTNIQDLSCEPQNSRTVESC